MALPPPRVLPGTLDSVKPPFVFGTLRTLEIKKQKSSHCVSEGILLCLVSSSF